MQEPDQEHLAGWLKAAPWKQEPGKGGEAILPVLALIFGLAALLCLLMLA